MKAIIVDDEKLALDFLESQIKKVSNIAILGKFQYFDIEENLSLIREANIVFLDIEMPEINGLELAEKILEVNQDLTVIFVTAFTEYAVEAFEINALDYIVKPVNQDRLKKTLERIESSLANQPQKTFSDESALHLKVCKELSFELGDKNSEVIQWRTSKAKEAFLYLLLHYGKTVRKSELIDLLWEDFELDKAYSQLYTTIYHIRNTLKHFRNHFSIESVPDGYILKVSNLLIDTVEWEERLKKMPIIDMDTIEKHEENMKLYSGGYLENEDYLWADSERYRLERLWIRTAHEIAKFYHNNEDIEKAESWYIKICNYISEDEKAHFSLMKIYEKLGYGLLVDHQYSQLEQTLNDLDIQISPNIQAWYQKKRNKKSSLEID